MFRNLLKAGRPARRPPRLPIVSQRWPTSPPSPACSGEAREKFHYLSHALGGILVFVGLKMTVSHWIHLNTYMSLAIIVGMLVAAITFSVRHNRTAAPDAAPAAR